MKLSSGQANGRDPDEFGHWPAAKRAKSNIGTCGVSAVGALVNEFGALVDAEIRPALQGDAISFVRLDDDLACSTADTPMIATYLRKLAREELELIRLQHRHGLAVDVACGVKASGRGYGARVERVLRDALATDVYEGRDL